MATVELFYSRSAPNQDLEGQSYLLYERRSARLTSGATQYLPIGKPDSFPQTFAASTGRPGRGSRPYACTESGSTPVMSEANGGWGAVLRTTVLPEVLLAGSGYDLAAIEFDAVPPGGWAEVIPR